ncbi:coiled-coil domain-containing protein 1-like [Papaver somniferum]|uniref:coiled-coil domain-containing protein 1-like n=1 Tax=Papaver somniferum TaxID=3469 RepID=UPI000E701995|nr:coiled-coil domain-containing protein 1-like [Papaver somniferum]
MTHIIGKGTFNTHGMYCDKSFLNCMLNSKNAYIGRRKNSEKVSNPAKRKRDMRKREKLNYSSLPEEGCRSKTSVPDFIHINNRLSGLKISVNRLKRGIKKTWKAVDSGTPNTSLDKTSSAMTSTTILLACVQLGTREFRETSDSVFRHVPDRTYDLSPIQREETWSKEPIVSSSGKCVNIKKLFKQYEQLDEKGAMEETLQAISRAIHMEVNRRVDNGEEPGEEDSEDDEPLENVNNDGATSSTHDYNDHSPIQNEEAESRNTTIIDDSDFFSDEEDLVIEETNECLTKSSSENDDTCDARMEVSSSTENSIMVTSSISDYDSSSISCEEDYKISAAKARAKTDHAKEIVNSMPLNDLKVSHNDLSKRKSREEIIADYQEKRRRIQRKILEAEEKLRSRPDGVASDSNAEEEEPVWEPMERRSKPYPPYREIKRLVKDDLQAEHDEEDYWYAIYGDLEEEEFPSSDSDSEKESEEDSTDDDDDDDKSNDSDD